MTTSKVTKKALFSSVLALVLCFAMLLGTTFAWFTDTASTSVNTIQAGKLDIKLFDTSGNSLEGETLSWQKAGGDENAPVLWEPGCTYSLQPITIKNVGNLALKYNIVLTGIQGDAELNQVIDWTISFAPSDVATQTEDDQISVANLTNRSLLAGASETLTISGTMKTNAGNEYQGKTIENIAIAVLATQDTVEYDSNDNQYDATAEYPAASGLVTEIPTGDAVTEGSTITVVGTEVDLPTQETNGVTISGLGGTTLKTNATDINADNVTIKDVTINGTGASGTTGTLNIHGNNTRLENVNYVGANSGSAITVSTGADNTGTVFKNTTVTNAFRGIQFWSLSGDSLIDNCTLDVAGYPFNIDAVTAGATLTVRNSTLKGWTSYTSGISLVKFENCTFGKNTYEYLRPYSTTTLTNCKFDSDDFELNAGGNASYTITLTNCTKNGTAITADNVLSLLLDTEDWNTNATLIVNGTTVTVS